MRNRPFPHPVTAAIEHADLMVLGAPINPYEPLVGQRLIVLFYIHGARPEKGHRSLSPISNLFLSGYRPYVSLGPVLALEAQLSTRRIPRLLSLTCTSPLGTLGAGHLRHCEREDHHHLARLYQS